MKATITYDYYNYFFEVMINNDENDYFMMCQALEADGYKMVNNGWPEDGATYTVYHKKIDMNL